MNRMSNEDIRWMLELLEAEGLAEIEVREGESQVVITAALTDPHVVTSSADRLQSGPELDEHHIPVLAPVAGVFYRGGSPEVDPLVDIGDEVVYGDAVGLVEAMKLFNEIPAPASGVIISILAKDNQQIAADQLLMIIET